ncbi:zf-TFIIB domain-containing protein [Aliiroseovarius sp. S1339]|uniref:TFIIB-type zinc ribbon-containing protein n=1 Tax=Aliiroseovarius sp. S1339 TaxID=2936990 RepID=UPI0020BDB7A5|nr:zf-TFIIB domain-containing protein [Aliiroseovarius sp. S1339]MCK8465038.1 zf-TFIIB domain-containing protein [Aliiroseovarius sp. S1339]
MKCPIDGTELKMSERQGVEIDYCPQCRGVWLDRGELDKIIEKATPAVVLPDPDPVAPPPVPDPVVAREPRPKHYDNRAEEEYRKRSDRDRYRDDYDDDDDDDYRHGRRYKKRKRKSILSEIFDFD